jgi:hypothetical protein
MVQGGIFLRKMPLGIEDSVKTRIETAVALLNRPATSAGARSERGFEAMPGPASAPRSAGYSHPFYRAPFILTGNFQ